MRKEIAALLPLAMSNTREWILDAFVKAYGIDKKQTLQMLLYLRDKNNWAWKIQFVRTCLLWIKRYDEEVFNKVIIDFILIWRWDDCFFTSSILNEHVIRIIKSHLDNWDTLLKKWLPRETSNPKLSREIAKQLWLTMKEYRLSLKTNWQPFINTLFRPINSYQINI